MHHISQTLTISTTIVQGSNLAETQFIIEVIGSKLTLNGIGKGNSIENLGTERGQWWVRGRGGHHGQTSFIINRHGSFC